MLTYSQLAQFRENSTSAVAVYSPGAGESAFIFLKVANVAAVNATVSVFHDDNGSTFDENTALCYNLLLRPGEILEMCDIFMNDTTGYIGYQSSVANALTITIYGGVRT